MDIDGQSWVTVKVSRFRHNIRTLLMSADTVDADIYNLTVNHQV